MQRREKILLIAVLVLLALWQGWPIVQQTLLGPLEERRLALQTLESDVRNLEDKDFAILRATKQMARWRERSLPPNGHDAQRLYLQWLADTAQLAGLKDLNVTGFPRLTVKGPYVPVQVRLQGKGTLDQISKFLHQFHRIDLLHRIVTMDIKSPAAEGNPQCTLDTTAEALALRDAPARDRLFPETEIAADLSPSATDLTVAAAEGFPKEPGFRIRMGNEYATVTKIEGEKWTLKRGSDVTAAAAHKKGDVVELAPVNPEYAERTAKDYEPLIAKNPFVKPAPPAAATPKDDEAQSTHLVSSVAMDGVYQAMLFDRANDKRYFLNVGSSLSVADITASVLEINNDGMVLERDNARWFLRLGDHLRQMQQLPAAPAAEAAPTTGATPPQSAADKAASTATRRAG